MQTQDDDAGAVRRGVARRIALRAAAALTLGGAATLGGRTAAGATASPTATPTTPTASPTTPTSPIPTLPGEVSRTATRYSRIGKKPYECIDVVVGGDRARLYTPWTAPLRGMASGSIVWFFHANGSDHTAMDGAFAYPGQLVVDQGGICITPNYGGSLWTNTAAIGLVTTWARWVASTFAVGAAFARGNSGGGSLMSYAYGKGMIPALRGIYLANGTYDMEELYSRDPGRIGPPYGNDPVAIAATNPARLAQRSWAGKRIKVVVSEADVVVPPARHGLALTGTARPVAADVRIAYHDGGHAVPGWTHTDMIATFNAWRP